MADIDSTQAGPFHLGTTWEGGSVPTGTQSCKIDHLVTLEQDLDEATITIQIGTNGTLDTQNAAGSNDYSLTCKYVLMWYSTSTFKMRSGTHIVGYSGGNSLNIVNAGATVQMSGTTWKSSGFYVRGILQATGENTMYSGWKDEKPTQSCRYYGRGEGNYNDGTGWEEGMSRVHVIYDQTNVTGSSQSSQYFTFSDNNLNKTADVDGDDGPFHWRFASLTFKNLSSKNIYLKNEQNDTEWSWTNSICLDVGAGGHSLTGEGNVTFYGGSVKHSHDDEGYPIGMRIRGNLSIGDNSTTNSVWYCGSSTASGDGGRSAFTRIDGNLVLDGSGIGDYDATIYMPMATGGENIKIGEMIGSTGLAAGHDTKNSLVTDDASPYANVLLGVCYIGGTITNEGRIYNGGEDGDCAWVHDNGGTYRIYIGHGDNSNGFYDGGTDSTQEFSLSHLREFAVTGSGSGGIHPSGISVGVRPVAGDDLQISNMGHDATMLIDQNLTVTDVTIDSGCTLNVSADITLTYTGSLTNNGALHATVTHDAVAKTMVGAAANRTASVTGNWNATATWGGSSVPDEDDPVVINTARTMTMNVDGNAKSVLFNSGSGQIVLSGGSTLNVPVAQSGDDGKITLQHADSRISGSGNIKGLSAAQPVHCTFRSDTDCEILGNLENCYLKSGSDITIHGSAINCTFEDSTANIRVWTHTLDSQQMLDSDPGEDDDLKLERPALDSNLLLTN